MTSVESDPTDKMSGNESVQVIVKCRPLSFKEIEQDCKNVVKICSNRGVVEVENLKAKSDNERSKIFTYDVVYDEGSAQQTVYDETIRPLVSSVLEGYNGCVFAYGQTGTGKTYTMEGGDGEEVGIIPRAFEQIWAHIARKTGVEFLVSVRYMEIYMEEIRDLLRIKSKKVHELREQVGQGVVVTNLHSHTCQSAKDMFKAMKTGNFNRTTGATNMNEHSSRSHAIFQIIIEMVEGDSKSMKVGKLNLVDLAGSERQSKTGATGDRLKEATKINKALSSLGNVIYALAENSAHIPYRDSKLTRLLQDSLGGNSKTIMIANIGPASMNYDETIITLRYANRAKSIKNKPIKNEDIKEGKLLMLQEEVERLKALILERSNGGLVDGLAGEDEDLSSDSDSESVEKERKLEEGKLEVDELAKKLKALEKRMVHGGKDIVDSVNENELKLEQQRTEIVDRKKREIEMQHRIELEEETCTELKQVFASLQQQVDFKRDKLKRLNNKLQSIRQEVKDNHEVYLKDRQEIENANDEAAMHLRQSFLIIDNFVPSEERSRIISLAQFDEDSDNWVIKKDNTRILPSKRPVAHNYKRPISDFAVHQSQTQPKYRGENVLDLKLDMPLRTTQDYAAPTICPQIKALVTDVIKREMENSHVIIRVPPHSVMGRSSTSKLEQEGKYKQALRSLVDVHSFKNSPPSKPVPPRSARSSYQLKQA
ncbi:kinesin-like protein Klp68D [Euwallacea similis]|uniref:kinesin-like protein Klp68D n=1 Tax=Euwallacea similis TaxID=1736056 RepID=UPI00344B79AB